MEIFRDEGRPRLLHDGTRYFGSLLSVFGYEQLFEEKLVGQAANLWAAPAVDLVAAPHESQSAVQRVLDARVDHLSCGEGLVGLLQFVGDAVVLFASEVARDGAGHDTTGEPFAFLGQLLNSPLGPRDLGLRLALLVVEFGAQSATNLVLDGNGQPDSGVVALNGAFDVRGRQVALGALSPTLVAADAEEVQVAALGVGQAQAAAAVGAEDGAFEVMAVGALLLPCSAGVQDVLHAVKQGLRDERLVTALVLSALEGDVAKVVTIRQQSRDMRHLERAGDLAAPRQCAQPFGGQGLG